jgi:hypothetical protein
MKRRERSGDTQPSRVIPARFVKFCLVFCLVSAGCTRPDTSFEIVNYRDHGQIEHLRETFPEAYYDVDREGNIDIVLRAESKRSADNGSRIVQIVRLRSFWRCMPGRTVANRTQLNATVTYCVISPAIVASYAGAGSLFVSQGKHADELTGEVELARLSPGTMVVGDDPVFERSELSGTFQARRDPRQVTRLVNEIERVFGPK